MKQFWQFLSHKPKLKLSFIFAAIFLCFLPARGDYYQLDLTAIQPVIRVVSFSLPPLSNYPVNFTNVPAPQLTARAAIVIDADSKAILFDKNPNLRLLPASLTKIMTALVALDKYALTDVVTIGNIETDPYLMELQPGEQISVENLLFGLLVASANDAALALAQFYPQGETAFVGAMNQKAQDLHLTNTQFTNVVGFDDFGHYTTVHDLSLLAATAMLNPKIKSIVATKTITVTDTTQTITHELENLNELIETIPGVIGLKTGRTDLAGECLITFIQRENHSIIIVVLGSFDRFGETRQLIEWVFTNHRWQAQSATHS